MPQLLAGKTALILGIANKWSLAYAIAQAFRREGATLVLSYQGERLKRPVEELGAERGIECQLNQDDDSAHLRENAGEKLDTGIHSIAFANREDLEKPFV